MTILQTLDRVKMATTDYLQLHDLTEAKNFFGPISKSERIWRSQQSFGPLLASARSKLGIGEHDRGEAYMFGGHDYPHADQKSLERHFPLNVKHIYADILTIHEGQTVDFSASASEFPWDVAPGELYLKITIGKLLIGKNSGLQLRGNVFILDCQNIEALPDQCASFHIQLRDDGIPASRIRLTAPVSDNLRNGKDGANGRPAQEPVIVQTPFYLDAKADTAHGVATAGKNGSNGQPGENGDNGGMLYLADIRLRKLTNLTKGAITIDAKAGDGFPGSHGGNGGNGGQGGDGANGIQTPSGLVGRTKGGQGGNGGSGGNGGNGGNGGLACDVYVSLPPAGHHMIQCLTSQSVGGRAGDGGTGGKGGSGGMHGGIPDQTPYSYARSGANGPDGLKGRNGKSRPAPQIVLFENTHP